jgi:hypothetical protein
MAHSLVRRSYDSDVFVFWDCDPPSFVQSDVLNDVSLFKACGAFLGIARILR